jgi:transketolase
MADIFAALYFSFLNTTPENPSHENRDYCLLSNGHICPIYYAALARRGFFPIEEMQKLRKIDSLLQGHPKLSIPGVENSSGPLGHGLSQAVGIALALKMDQRKNRVVCCMSDGEHQEGQTWEAVMSANKWNLDNLIAIMDCNRLQIEGTTDEIMPL